VPGFTPEAGAERPGDAVEKEAALLANDHDLSKAHQYGYLPQTGPKARFA